MRLNQIFYRTRRAFQRESEVPFKEAFPLKLGTKYSGLTKKTLDDKCLFQLSLLIACWQKSDFSAIECQDLVEQLKICNEKLLKSMRQEKISRKQDIPTPKSRHLTEKQATYLLRKYPTI